MAAQLAAQRAQAQGQAEADKQEEDNQLKKVASASECLDQLIQHDSARCDEGTDSPWVTQQLHDALVVSLASDDAAVREAASVRPAPETVEMRLEEVKKMARAAKCVICLDDDLTVLDGIFCRAVPTGLDTDHFLCADCFARHVAAECEKPEFNGDVHCAHHTLGCVSAPYHDALLARHITPPVFKQLQEQRLKLRETANNRRMQVRFGAGARKLLGTVVVRRALRLTCGVLLVAGGFRCTCGGDAKGERAQAAAACS